MIDKNLTPKQRELLESIEHAIADAEFEGATIDPTKIATWKKYVMEGMEFDELFELIRNDRAKVIAVRPKPEHRDAPGMKHMGNGYFISGDDPTDPPVK